jgi:hypothetical protein
MYILCINLLANKYVVYLIFINLYLMFNSMVTGFVFNKTMFLFFFFSSQILGWSRCIPNPQSKPRAMNYPFYTHTPNIHYLFFHLIPLKNDVTNSYLSSIWLMVCASVQAGLKIF